jgi:hypothetical protein
LHFGGKCDRIHRKKDGLGKAFKPFEKGIRGEYENE